MLAFAVMGLGIPHFWVCVVVCIPHVDAVKTLEQMTIIESMVIVSDIIIGYIYQTLNGQEGLLCAKKSCCLSGEEPFVLWILSYPTMQFKHCLRPIPFTRVSISPSLTGSLPLPFIISTSEDLQQNDVAG